MARKDDKIGRAAHIKAHTEGTSNEISLSVLDAAKHALDSKREPDAAGGVPHAPIFGKIALFTLPGRRKKPVSTPTKDRELVLPSDEAAAAGAHALLGEDSFEAPDSLLGNVSRETLPAASLNAVDDATQPSRLDAKAARRAARRRARAAEKTVSDPQRPEASVSSSSLSQALPARPKRSPEEEIALRKARRRLSRIVGVGVVSVATAALLAVGGMYLYRDFQAQQGAEGVLAEAIDGIRRADEVIIPLDDVVSDPFGDETAATRDELESGLAGAAALLDEADERARQASATLRNPKAQDAANQAIATIDARRRLLESGKEILAASHEAQSEAERLAEVWEGVLDADEAARQAASAASEGTAEALQASKDQTAKAIDLFTSASTALADVQADSIGADYADLSSYLAKRIEALGHAQASDDALIARNKDEAAVQNDAYNVAEAEAAAIAQRLPGNLETLVYDVYEQDVSAAKKAYSTARSQAGTCDAIIRDYLGANGK